MSVCVCVLSFHCVGVCIDRWVSGGFFLVKKNRALKCFSHCTCALGELTWRRHLVGIFASVLACVYLSVSVSVPLRVFVWLSLVYVGWQARGGWERARARYVCMHGVCMSRRLWLFPLHFSKVVCVHVCVCVCEHKFVKATFTPHTVKCVHMYVCVNVVIVSSIYHHRNRTHTCMCVSHKWLHLHDTTHRAFHKP